MALTKKIRSWIISVPINRKPQLYTRIKYIKSYFHKIILHSFKKYTNLFHPLCASNFDGALTYFSHYRFACLHDLLEVIVFARRKANDSHKCVGMDKSTAGMRSRKNAMEMLSEKTNNLNKVNLRTYNYSKNKPASK